MYFPGYFFESSFEFFFQKFMAHGSGVRGGEKAICRIWDGAERGETVLVNVPDFGRVWCVSGGFGGDQLKEISYLPSFSLTISFRNLG
jgi:hypothetical protein